jgi:hypothetical protein
MKGKDCAGWGDVFGERVIAGASTGGRATP